MRAQGTTSNRSTDRGQPLSPPSILQLGRKRSIWPHCKLGDAAVDHSTATAMGMPQRCLVWPPA